MTFDKTRLTGSTATLSEEMIPLYRYTLGRRWDERLDYVLFVMLNPSTADATVNDPTIMRCIGFADSWGYGGIEVRNLFAFRTAYPKELTAAGKAGTDIVGAENDRFLTSALRDPHCKLVVGGWGAQKIAEKRVKEVRRHVTLYNREMLCIHRQPRDTFPRHPLYLPGDAELDVCP